MDNLAALRANLSDAHGVVLGENHFVKALVDEGLAPETLYSPTVERQLDLATIRLYNLILGGAGLSEGSLGYNFQLPGVVAAKKNLQEKWGLIPDIDPRDSVNTASVW